MNRNIVGSAIAAVASILALNANSCFAQPSPDDYRNWCQQEENRLNQKFKTPKNFDEKKSGKLRAIVLFHLTKDGQAQNLRHLRKNAADRAVLTVPEKEFVEIENAMIAAVKATQPMKPVPKSFSRAGEGVSFAYEPNSEKRIRVLVFAE